MVRFTLRQCRYFQAVAAHGGVAQAARALNISQPAVAQGIDKLEQSTGLTLFTRHHARGMELTLQGRAFLEEAQALLSRAERMNHAVADVAANRRGTIRLGCFQSIAPFCLARIVRQHGSKAPDVAIEVMEGLQRDLELALRAGEIDLAIMYNLGLDPHEIGWQDVTQARPYVIVSEAHRLAARRRVSLRDLGGDDYVLFDAPGSREYFNAIFAQHGINPRIAFRSTSLESVRSAVANDLGFSILATRPVSQVTYEGHQVVPVEIADDIEPTPVVVAYRSGTQQDALLRDFIGFCRATFSPPKAARRR